MCERETKVSTVRALQGDVLKNKYYMSLLHCLLICMQENRIPDTTQNIFKCIINFSFLSFFWGGGGFKKLRHLCLGLCQGLSFKGKEKGSGKT